MHAVLVVAQQLLRFFRSLEKIVLLFLSGQMRYGFCTTLKLAYFDVSSLLDPNLILV